MARLLDLEMTSGGIAVRAVLAVVFGGLAFLLFYYVPASLGSLLTGAISSNSTVGGAAKSIVDSLISPNLAPIGLGVAALVFVGAFLRGTKAYGPVLIVLGAALLAYVYTAFQGGNVSVAIPSSVGYSASGSVSVGVAVLMYLFLLPPLLTLLKGVVLTAMKPGAPAAPAPA